MNDNDGVEDEELFEEFLDEVDDMVDEMEHYCTILEADHTNREAIHGIFRSFIRPGTKNRKKYPCPPTLI